MRTLLPFLLILGMTNIMGCAIDRQYENYNMTTTADLTLSAENHRHGFTKAECFSCHLPQNIHQVDHLGAPSFALAKQLIEASGLASCSGCHGTNGVTP